MPCVSEEEGQMLGRTAVHLLLQQDFGLRLLTPREKTSNTILVSQIRTVRSCFLVTKVRYRQIRASQDVVLTSQQQASDAPVQNIGQQDHIRNSYVSPTIPSAPYAQVSLPWLNQIGTDQVGQMPGGPSLLSTRPVRGRLCLIISTPMY